MATLSAINAVYKAIETISSYDLDKVSQALEDEMSKRVTLKNKSATEAEIEDGIDKKLYKMGIKGIKDVREIILQVERVRM